MKVKGLKKKNVKLSVLGALVVVLAGGFLYARFAPVETHDVNVSSWKAFKDDALAEQFLPVLYADLSYGLPTDVFYRAAKEGNGTLHFAYHYVWDREVNKNSGFYPFLSRSVYTGGLKIQKMMFGKGDVEVIEVVVSPEGTVKELHYEKAQNYDPTAFAVSHVWVKKNMPNLDEDCLYVMSWNHLFELEKKDVLEANAQFVKTQNTLQYFSNRLWKEYEMFKHTTTRLKKNRAHFDYERIGVE